MNVDELKKLVKHSTAVLVLDNGEPSFAILSYEMYKDLVLGNKEKEINALNKEKISASGKDSQRYQESIQNIKESYDQTLTSAKEQDDLEKKAQANGDTAVKRKTMSAHYFTMMKQLTILGYFTSKEGRTGATR